MNRKHHYDLQWDKPKPFVERRHCLEVDERIELRRRRRDAPLDEEGAREPSPRFATRGFADIAVCFLFSYVNPEHELRMREIIAEVHPDANVSLSHEVYPRWREYDRTSTTLADAFLKTLVGDYLENLAAGLAPRDGQTDLLDHEVERRRRGLPGGRGKAGRPACLWSGRRRPERHLLRPPHRAARTSSRWTWAARASTSA